MQKFPTTIKTSHRSLILFAKKVDIIISLDILFMLATYILIMERVNADRDCYVVLLIVSMQCRAMSTNEEAMTYNVYYCSVPILCFFHMIIFASWHIFCMRAKQYPAALRLTLIEICDIYRCTKDRSLWWSAISAPLAIY